MGSAFIRRTDINNVERLHLSEGRWVEVKRRLNNAEQEKVAHAGLSKISMKSEEVQLDWDRVKTIRLNTWILDWNFTDDHDKKVPVNLQNIEELDPDIAEEIHVELDKHIQKLDDEKKARAGTSVNASN